MSKEDLAKALSSDITEAECPECKEVFPRDSEGHSFDAIYQFKKCISCLGWCPYCKDRLENETREIIEKDYPHKDVENNMKLIIASIPSDDYKEYVDSEKLDERVAVYFQHQEKEPSVKSAVMIQALDQAITLYRSAMGFGSEDPMSVDDVDIMITVFKGIANLNEGNIAKSDEEFTSLPENFKDYL